MTRPVWVNLGITTDNTQAWTRGSSLDFGTWTPIANLQSIQVIIGTQFADYLHGDQNNNIIDGVAAKNQIDGGGGNDTLIGGSGLNTFIFDPGHGNDTVVDFNPSRDVIEFTGGADGFTSLADVLAKTTEVVLPDGSTSLQIQGSDGTILLEFGELSYARQRHRADDRRQQQSAIVRSAAADRRRRRADDRRQQQPATVGSAAAECLDRSRRCQLERRITITAAQTAMRFA